MMRHFASTAQAPAKDKQVLSRWIYAADQRSRIMKRAERTRGRGSETMKLNAFLMAGMLIAGTTMPSFAFEAVYSNDVRMDQLVHRISCNVNDDDKQAICMRTCDDDYIKASQAYGTAGRLEGPKEAKKACETKCGC
jgi:hypothetical protein